MTNSTTDYRISAHVAERIRDGGDTLAASQAVIADIVTQRLQSHHRDAMDAIANDTLLTSWLELAPPIVSMTLASDEPIELDVGIVQQMTDDLVTLGIRAFAERYNNADLIEMYDSVAATGPTQDGAHG